MKLNKSQEYERLKALFKDVEPTKVELVEELLNKAAFIKCELDNLETQIKKYGAVERSNKGNVRESIYYKTYLSTVNVYQGLIRTLNTVIGKNVIDVEDEFDDFMRNASGT